MNFAALAALTLALGYAAFYNGGVDTRDWFVCLLVVGATCTVYFVGKPRSQVPPFDPFAATMLLVFLSISALQLLPLPVGVVRVLSPARMELFEAVARVTGQAPGFVTISATPFQSARLLLTAGGYLAVLILIRTIAYTSRSIPWAAVVPLLFVGVAEAVLGIYQAHALGGQGFATGTYVNRDDFAALLAMIGPFAAMYAFAVFVREGRPLEFSAVPALQAAGALVVVAVLLIGVVYSQSRMGYIGALSALFIAGFFALKHQSRRLFPRTGTRSWRRWVAPTLLVAIMALAFFFLPTVPLINRFAEVAKAGDLPADARVQLWRDTMGLIKEYPLLGCGLGGYESCFYKFKTVAPMNSVELAHNDYLQVVAEVGIPGFLAGLLFVASMFQRSIRSGLHARSIDDFCLAAACTASMTAMLLHSLIDTSIYVPANGFVSAWVFGIAGLNLQRQRPSAPRATASEGDLEAKLAGPVNDPSYRVEPLRLSHHGSPSGFAICRDDLALL